ncbi:MAG: hypothetical protein RR357_04560 [Clostridia bacterium]
MRLEIKTGFRMFIKNPFLNAIIILLLTLCISVIYYISTIAISSNTIGKMFSTISKENGVYFRYTSLINDGQQFISGLKGVKMVLHQDSLSATDRENSKRINCNIYDDNLAKYIKSPLAKGKWFSDCPTNGNDVNAVIVEGNGYNVGDKINITVINEGEFTLHITGLLPRNFYIVSTNGYGSPPTAELIIENHKSKDFEMLGITVICGNIPNLKREFGNNPIIIFNDDITDEVLQTNLNAMNDNGYYMTFSEMTEGTKKARNEIIGMLLPIIILLCLITMVSFIVTCLITFEKSKEMLGVIICCGGKPKNIIMSYSWYCVIIAAISILLYALIVLFVFSKMLDMGLSTNKWLLPIIPICMIAVLSLNIFLQVWRIEKNKLSVNYKGD